MTGVVSVAITEDAFGSPILALMEDGTVQAWGEWNIWGQLGDGTTLPRQTRVKVQGLDQVVALSTSGTSLAVRADGTVWNTGGNLYGERGFSSWLSSENNRLLVDRDESTRALA